MGARSKTAGRPVYSRPAVKCTAPPLHEPWHDTLRATPDRADPARQASRIEGQRAQELRRAARLRNVLEPRSELDQGRLAEGRAHEADAYGHTEHEAHRHVDDGVAHDRRRSRGADDEVIAIDQVRRPGRVVRRGDDRVHRRVAGNIRPEKHLLNTDKNPHDAEEPVRGGSAVWW